MLYSYYYISSIIFNSLFFFLLLSIIHYFLPIILQTALHLAVHAGSEEAVQALISAGANVNIATNFEKCTPLHLACEGDWRGICKLLLESGKY